MTTSPGHWQHLPHLSHSYFIILSKCINDLTACKNFSISNEEINNYQEQINFVLGEKDKLIPLKYVEKFCEGLKNSEILILDNLSHFTFYEDPTKLSSELGKLLSN
mgnify:CR=1 FL=1